MRVVLLLVCAGCSFHHDLGDAGTDRPDTPIIFDDGGNEVGWLRADTDGDFGEPGATLDAIAIDPGTAPIDATLTPAAYFWGGLVARGTAACPVADQNALDYNAFASLTPAGLAFVDTIELTDNHAPAGIRVDATDGNWGYWLEGEMQLAAGTTTFTLDADDFAAFEIAPPQSTTFTRVATNQYQQVKTTAAYITGASGWYPIRIAMCQATGGGYHLSLLATNDATPAAAIPRRFLRARVDAMRGVMVTAWDQRAFGMRASTSLWTTPVIDDTLDPLPPGPKDTQDNSIRWVGETKIATAGDYAAHADTDDGARITLGTTTSDDHLPNGGPDVITDVTATLAPGWRPLALDFNNQGGDGRARLQVDPVGTGPTATLAVDHLRPIPTSGIRAVAYSDDQSIAIANDGTPQVRTWRSGSFPNETITDLWLTYAYTHAQPKELVLVLTAPDGSAVTVRASGVTDTTNPVHLRIPSFTGKPLTGTNPWKLAVKDPGGGATGTLDGWSLTAFVTGGPTVLAPASSWVSATHEINATVIDSITYTATLPTGTTAAAWVRTCDETPCPADGPWTGPYQSGDAVIAPPKRYAQIRIDLTATTDEEPAVDWVQLQYRFRP